MLRHSTQSLSATSMSAASWGLIHTVVPPRARESMNRLSWYSEWIDHLLCGVRYRTAIDSSPRCPSLGSPNRRCMSRGGR
ncbi:hypothetical protein AVL61_16415 [Kocuria rosea subsp. polaris]|uniref:Uncharacterized protein n=1 Tax=Kocuria rosea subsp. polaris TaxID=136273 RepID=A0A0W8IHS0_KOCRO|nr:hypothetical protein AVL61_16415 [Kocuria polaris]